MFLRKKHLLWRLVSECAYEILNTIETLLNDKKVASTKSNCLVQTILLVNIPLLLLLVICVSCYFYYTKYWSKQRFHDINIKLGKIKY